MTQPNQTPHWSHWFHACGILFSLGYIPGQKDLSQDYSPVNKLAGCECLLFYHFLLIEGESSVLPSPLTVCAALSDQKRNCSVNKERLGRALLSEACKERNDLGEGVVREITQNKICGREIQCVMYSAWTSVRFAWKSQKKRTLWETPMALDILHATAYIAATFPCLDTLFPC